jgi:hypothetical protein
LVPIWIFGWVIVGQLFAKFALDKHSEKWWSLPLWMSVFTPGLFAMVLGIVYVIKLFIDPTGGE